MAQEEGLRWEGGASFAWESVAPYDYCTTRTAFDFVETQGPFYFSTTLYCGGMVLGTLLDTKPHAFGDAQHLHLSHLFEEMNRQGMVVDQCDRKLYHCRFSRRR